MNKISVIIPVHEIKENDLTRAVNSVPKRENISIIIVGPKDVITTINNMSFDNEIITIVNKDETDFCSQINLAAKKCKTKYFSILEQDDYYSDIWFDNVNKYINYYKDDVSLYLPISKLTKYDNNDITALINEIAWSSAFADENGFINTDCLNAYYDFLISGGIFNTKDFTDLGGLKPSLMIASSYEFLLRMAHNSKKVFVIPKIGYNHTIGNPESYTITMSNKITQKHGEWLLNLAREEKFFNEDRNKIFEE